jgi:uncharacterized protein YuzE
MKIAPSYFYDKEGDILYVSFYPGEKGTGVELNNNILLRLDKDREKALGLTFFDFSILIQKTEFGPRSFPLTGLVEIPEELREVVFRIITTQPVSDFLRIMTYSPTLTEEIPITCVEKPSSLTAHSS